MTGSSMDPKHLARIGEPLDTAVLQSMRLLCVEENAADRAMVRQMLQQTGLTIECVEVDSYQTAIAAVESQPFDCVLMDAQLADGNALDFLAKTQNVSVIVLTGKGDERLAVQLMKAGVADYLSKQQVSPEELHRSLYHVACIASAQAEREQIEHQLQLSEERYRLTLDGSNDGIWDWMISQEKIVGNDRLWEMLGLDAQLTPLTVEQLKRTIHPQDYDVIKNALDRHLQHQEKFSVEIRLQHYCGEYRDFWLRGKLQKISSPTDLRMCGLITDITERKRHEKHTQFLTQASSLLNASLDFQTTLASLAWLAVPQIADWCIFEIRIDHHDRNHYVATHHVDTTKEPLVKEFHAALRCDAIIPLLDDQDCECLESHSYAIEDLPTLAATKGWSLDLLRQLGLQSYLQVPLDVGNRCVGYIFLAWVDSDRHCSPADLELVQELSYRATWAVENARLDEERQLFYGDLQGAIADLKKQQQHLQTLQHLTTLINQRLTNIPELLKVLVFQMCEDIPAAQVCSIALFDPSQEGDFLVVTDGMHQKAITLDSLLNQEKNWLRQVYDEGTPHLRSFPAHAPMPCSMAAVAIESVASGRLGVLVVGNWQIQQAFDLEDCDFLTAVSEQAAIAIDNARLIKTLEHRNRDLAETNQALEEQQQQIEQQNRELIETSRVKDLFLASVSHELRTPMNAILGLSQVLLKQRKSPLRDRQQQILERILRNGRSLMALINDILDFSQMKLTEVQLLPSRFNIEELISNIVWELQSLADEKQLELQFQSDLQSTSITHDQKRIRQIVVNLLANALSFTQQGHVDIRLFAVDDQHFCIQVKDTGIGIAPEHLEHIFSEFWQVQQEMHRTQSGTGLGLAITHSLVKIMQGQITVESELNHGSTFTVTLPRQLETTPSQLSEGIISA